MSIPSLLLGPKFKVLSFVGLSGSGIIGSFAAIYKSAQRSSEIMNPAKSAVRKGLGYAFAGTSMLGDQAGEWINYLNGRRFEILGFVVKNGSRITDGQKSMHDQARDFGKSAHEFLKTNLKTWWEMLPLLFYYWNRARNTLFGTGLSEEDLKDELINQILSFDDGITGEMAEMLLENPTFKGLVKNLSGLMVEFQQAFNKLSGDNQNKAQEALTGVFQGFGEAMKGVIESMINGDGDGDQSKFKEEIKKLADQPKKVQEKFQEKGAIDDDLKGTQEATTKLLDWMISSLVLPALTSECVDGEEGCANIEVLDEEDQKGEED